MAPSSEKIAELFSHYLKGQLTIFEVAVSDPEFRTFSGNSNLSVNFSDDIKLRVAGQEFELAAQTEGIDELKEYLTTRLAPAILGAIDQSKPMTTEVIPVISGGEGPWAAVEFKATATSKKNKEWVHESLTLLRFDDDGKVCEARLYLDSLHLQNHILESSR